MTQQQNSSNTSGIQPYAKQSGSSQSNMSSDSNLNQVEQAYASSDARGQAGTNAAQAQSVAQQQPASASSPQGSTAQVQSNAQQQPAFASSPQGSTAQVQSNAQQQSASTSSSQEMSYETGLEYTADVIRKEKLKDKNQKATDSLVDRMYWQHEESLSKSVKVSDKGELENYDDTPGFGNDKPGL